MRIEGKRGRMSARRVPPVASSPEPGLVGSLKAAWDATTARARLLARRLREAAAPVQEAARDAVEATQEGADVVAETADRAIHLPQEIAREVRKELQVWTSGLERLLALGALAILLGIFALALLTSALVDWLNQQLGEPVGDSIVGLLYSVAAVVVLRVLTSVRRETQLESQEHVAHMREDVKDVAEPARHAMAHRADDRQQR